METTLDAKKSFINLRILLVPIAAATLLIKLTVDNRAFVSKYFKTTNLQKDIFSNNLKFPNLFFAS